MRDSLSIGPTPAEEKCEQAGIPGYRPERARKECLAFMGQLRRVFGEPPEGGRLKINGNGGRYMEVEAEFDDELPKSMEWAFKLERETPGEWDQEARKELGLDD